MVKSVIRHTTDSILTTSLFATAMDSIEDEFLAEFDDNSKIPSKEKLNQN